MSTSSPTLSKRPSFRGRFGGSRKPTSVEPQPGEKPIAVLRVQVIGCKELPAADMNGKSDPYVVLIFARQRQKTPVISKTLTPVYDPKTATFDFPMYASVLEKVGSLVEVVVWDKDVIGKDYLGELALPACDWFKYNGGAKGFNSPTNKDFWLPLVSSRSKRDAKGQIHLKLGFTVAPGTTAPDFDLVYTEHVTGGRGARNIMSVPPTEGFGTLGEHAAVDAGNESDDDDDMDHSPRHRRTSTLGSVPEDAPSPTKALTRTGSNSVKKLPTFRLNWSGTRIDYSFGAHQDVEGIVLLEVRSAANLPKLTGGVSKLVGGSWDMDPFVVINFNRKTFRTRVVRHSLEPEWNEKIMFHVRKADLEDGAKIMLTVLDWDKVQSNDHVGDATIDLAELMARAPKPDAKTGLFAADEDLAHGLKDLVLPLTVSKDVKTDGVKPSIYVRIKYDPHAFLRQRFWRATLHTSDTDKNGCWSRTELSAFLDKNGLSLAPEAVSKFFEDRNKDEITMDEAVESLEQAIGMRLEKGQRPEWAPKADTTSAAAPAAACASPVVDPKVETPATPAPSAPEPEPEVETAPVEREAPAAQDLQSEPVVEAAPAEPASEPTVESAPPEAQPEPAAEVAPVEHKPVVEVVPVELEPVVDVAPVECVPEVARAPESEPAVEVVPIEPTPKPEATPVEPTPELETTPAEPTPEHEAAPAKSTPEPEVEVAPLEPKPRAAPAIEPEAAPEVEAVEPPGPATSEPEAEPVVEAPAPAEPECQPVEPIVEPPAPVAAEPKPEPQVEPIDTSPSTPPDSEFVIVPKEEEAVSEPEELEVPAPQPEAPICEPAPPAIEPEAPVVEVAAPVVEPAPAPEPVPEPKPREVEPPAPVEEECTDVVSPTPAPAPEPPVEVATPAPLPPVDVVLPTPAPAPEPPVEVATPAPPPPVDVVPPAPAPAPEPVPEPKPREVEPPAPVEEECTDVVSPTPTPAPEPPVEVATPAPPAPVEVAAPVSAPPVEAKEKDVPAPVPVKEKAAPPAVVEREVKKDVAPAPAPVVAVAVPEPPTPLPKIECAPAVTEKAAHRSAPTPRHGDESPKERSLPGTYESNGHAISKPTNTRADELKKRGQDANKTDGKSKSTKSKPKPKATGVELSPAQSECQLVEPIVEPPVEAKEKDVPAPAVTEKAAHRSAPVPRHGDESPKERSLPGTYEPSGHAILKPTNTRADELKKRGQDANKSDGKSKSTKSKPKPKATGVELSPAQSDLATSYAALILADAEIDVSGANILALASAAGIALEPFWAEIFARGLEGRDVKSNLLNVGAGSGAPAVSAAPAMGGAVVCEAQPEEIKDEEKAESDSDGGFGGLFD